MVDLRILVCVVALAACGDNANTATADAPPPQPDSETTCSRCEDNDGCCPASCGRPNDSDCPAVGAPRLVIVDRAGGVGIWDDLSNLTNRPPDVVLAGIDGAPHGIAVHGGKLIVVSDGAEFPIALYSDASQLAAGAMPNDRIPATTVGASRLKAVKETLVDAAGNIFMLEGFGRILLVKAGALGSAGATSAEFSHPWEQIASMAVGGGKLFGGQISGAGILVWNDPLSKVGVQSGGDWQLAMNASWGMTIGGDRLYAMKQGAMVGLSMWNGVTALATPRAADVELVLSSRTAVGDLTWRSNALFAVVANGVNENRVAVFENSATLTPATMPDNQVTPESAGYLQKSYVDAAGNLYVLDRNAVYVYRDALGTPALVTKLTTFAQPVDFTVIE